MTTPTDAARPSERAESLKPSATGELTPNDHLLMLIEVMRPMGMELARRWVAALNLAPIEEREGIVSAVEAQMLELYRSGAGESLSDEPGQPAQEGLDLVEPPVQREGYIEQVVRTYGRQEGSRAGTGDRSDKNAG